MKQEPLTLLNCFKLLSWGEMPLWQKKSQSIRRSNIRIVTFLQRKKVWIARCKLKKIKNLEICEKKIVDSVVSPYSPSSSSVLLYIFSETTLSTITKLLKEMKKINGYNKQLWTNCWILPWYMEKGWENYGRPLLIHPDSTIMT